MVLPEVLKFNSKNVADLYCEIASDCLPGLEGKKNNIDNFIIGIEQLIIDLNIPRKLKEVGIDQKDIHILAEDALKQQRLLVNNPRNLDIEDAIAIYQSAL